MSGRKTVSTVSPAELRALSQELFAVACADGGTPEAVIGVATGGVRVVEAMELPESVGVFSCSMSRPSTTTKQRGPVQRTLRVLPRGLADQLRLVEDKVLERRQPAAAQPSALLSEQIDKIVAELEATGRHDILVVDDAVDSGSTLKCVVETLESRVSVGSSVRSAVLTVTRSPDRRLITPDYSLHQLVLLRFPWSHDYKPDLASS